MKEAREFIRLLRKIEKQKQSYAELISNTIETEQDLVSAVVDFMPMGMGLELRNGVKGYFLGDVIWRDGSAYIQSNKYRLILNYLTPHILMPILLSHHSGE